MSACRGATKFIEQSRFLKSVSSSVCLNAQPWCLLQSRGRQYLPFVQTKKKVQQKTKTDNSSEKASSSSSSVADDIKAAPVCASPFQAVRLMQSFCIYPEKKDPITLTLRVNADLKRESVRGVSQLPHGLGTDVRLLVFCADEVAKDMMQAGADFAGLSKPIERIMQGWLDFDRCLATPDVMKDLFKLAKVLGPRKLMPNPKSGTVVTNLKEAIKLSKSGSQIEFRAEGFGDIEVQIARTDFTHQQVIDNIRHFCKDVIKSRPRAGASGMSSGSMEGIAPFKWPPHPKKMANPLSAVPGLTVGGSSASKKDDMSDRFLLTGTLLAKGGPRVTIEPSMLSPNSVGYFR